MHSFVYSICNDSIVIVHFFIRRASEILKECGPASVIQGFQMIPCIAVELVCDRACASETKARRLPDRWRGGLHFDSG